MTPPPPPPCSSQGLILLLVGPGVDRLVTNQWVTSYSLNTPCMAIIFLTCLIAVVVNASQFVCLGRFSAGSFQVGGGVEGLGSVCLGSATAGSCRISSRV